MHPNFAPASAGDVERGMVRRALAAASDQHARHVETTKQVPAGQTVTREFGGAARAASARRILSVRSASVPQWDHPRAGYRALTRCRSLAVALMTRRRQRVALLKDVRGVRVS